MSLESGVAEWRVLRVGACSHPQCMAQRGGSWRATNFPALVGLIQHQTLGPILFDTGYDQGFFAATDPFPERLYRMTTPVAFGPADALETQLAGLGIKPEDIAAVVVSHFHGDHVAGLKAFPAAKIFCARQGLDRIRRPGRFNRVRQGLLDALVPDDIEARATFFEDFPPVPLGDALAPFTHGVDLLGDGSLIAVELAGHCPGHWGLWVRPETGTSVFFVGDAAWSLKAIAENLPPPRLTTALLGETQAYRQTLNALGDLHRRGGVEIIPSHCQVAASKWVNRDL